MKILSNIAQLLNAKTLNIPNGTADQVVGVVLDLVYFVTGIIAVIVIIVSGMKISVATDPATVAKSKDWIIHSVIALAIILSAFAVTRFIIGRL